MVNSQKLNLIGRWSSGTLWSQAWSGRGVNGAI